MKQRTIYIILAILTALINVGCPPTDTGNGPSEGEPPIPSSTGKVVISGNIYDYLGTKSDHTQTEIGDLFVTSIDYINIWFGEDSSVPSNQTNAYPYPFIVIVDQAGDFYSSLSIVPASYSLWIEAYDVNNKRLFFDSVIALVLPAQTTNVSLVLELVDSYFYEFQIDNMPGNWPATGDVIIIADSGANYFVSYSKIGNSLYFSGWLPIGFDGHTSSIEMVDLGGTTYFTYLNFDIFDAITGLVLIPYSGGNVNLTIGFNY